MADLDRNQPATAYKLNRARERGQVPKSTDLVGSVVLLVAMVYMTWQCWSFWQRQFALARTLFVHLPALAARPNLIWPVLQNALIDTLGMALPFFVTILLAAIIANLVQTGPILTTEPLGPNWERLNPVQGLKRLFSGRSLFLLMRALLKLVILGVAAYLILRGKGAELFRSASLAPLQQAHLLFDALASLGLKLAALAALIALIDLVYTRRRFAKDMRMSHREVKDEHKQREGDPRVKSRLRQLQREVLKRSRSLKNTRDADVVVVNPTHIAVALKYTHRQMVSPLVIAKGRGYMAAAMRQMALRHNVPIVHSPALARQLFAELEINQHVRPDLYAQVARIIVWVFAKRDVSRRLRQTQGRSV